MRRVTLHLSPNYTVEEVLRLEQILDEALTELERGDMKHGRHPGIKRGFGALRNEYNELQTELEAENGTPESIHLEANQVLAMGIKLMRDCDPLNKPTPQAKTSQTIIDDPDEIRELMYPAAL